MLKLFHEPKLNDPVLLMGMSGWMDSGEVSTGSLEYIRLKLGAVPFGEIKPDQFYIMNFPGSMEVSAMFRPKVTLAEGTIQKYDLPRNSFYACRQQNIILFEAHEPNIGWEKFSDAVFELCGRFNVKRILFVGSVAGLAPHTRDARINCTISVESLRPEMRKKGFRFANYEGPSSFVTYLTDRCAQREMEMASLIAEIPAYVQGYNPRSIETAIRCVSSLLDLQLDYEDLRSMGDEFEKRVNELVEEQPELAERVRQLEEIYDNEVFDSEMTDLKSWLQRRGVRLD